METKSNAGLNPKRWTDARRERPGAPLFKHYPEAEPGQADARVFDAVGQGGGVGGGAAVIERSVTR